MDLLRDLATQVKQGRAIVGSESGATDANGFFTFAHGLTEPPSKVLVFPTGAAASPDLAIPFLYAVDGLNVTLSFFALAGSAASLAVAFSYVLQV